ncbi:MAG: hypothetical protein ACREJX_15130 [Polyangiaceae bacterium]
MLNAGIAHAIESMERRGEDLSMVFTEGAQPNYSDVLRTERVEQSADPLSIVLPRDAFLLAGDPNHPTYTRDGALQIRDGMLAGSDGTPVLGLRGGDRSGIPQPLRIDGHDALLGRVHDLRIEPDGVFGYARTIVDTKTMESSVERIVVGRIALARFPAGTRLESIDATHARPPSQLVPFVGTPNDGSFASLYVGRRAAGGLDTDAAVVRLQDAYLAMRALSAEERSRNAMIHGALDLVK